MIEWQNKQVLKELTQKYTQPTPQYTPTPQIGPPKPPQPPTIEMIVLALAFDTLKFA